MGHVRWEFVGDGMCRARWALGASVGVATLVVWLRLAARASVGRSGV